MTAATALMILEIVGALFGVITEVPAVIEEIKSLMEKVRPYTQECEADVAAKFVALEQRLQGLG
jgi:hypothetical protein